MVAAAVVKIFEGKCLSKDTKFKVINLERFAPLDVKALTGHEAAWRRICATDNTEATGTTHQICKVCHNCSARATHARSDMRFLVLLQVEAKLANQVEEAMQSIASAWQVVSVTAIKAGTKRQLFHTDEYKERPNSPPPG